MKKLHLLRRSQLNQKPSQFNLKQNYNNLKVTFPKLELNQLNLKPIMLNLKISQLNFKLNLNILKLIQLKLKLNQFNYKPNMLKMKTSSHKVKSYYPLLRNSKIRSRNKIFQSRLSNKILKLNVFLQVSSSNWHRRIVYKKSNNFNACFQSTLTTFNFQSAINLKMMMIVASQMALLSLRNISKRIALPYMSIKQC